MSVSINGTTGLVFSDGTSQNTSPFGGPVVKNRKQAIAIAMSEAKMPKPKMMKKTGRGR